MKTTNFPFLSASQILRCGVILYVVLQFRDVKAGDWTTYQHDAAHTGRSTADFDPTSLIKVWGSNSGNTQPIVVGNTLYDLSGSGDPIKPIALTSYNLLSGQKNWSTNFAEGGGSHLSFADDLLLSAGRTSAGNYKLYAWDAANGTQRYVVDLPSFGVSAVLTPTVARNANNQLVAYLTGGGTVAAVALGASSGNVLWTSIGGGGQSIPTVVGDSVILTGPANYYAFDQLTGASNHFFGNGSIGGGGETVAYDSARKQVYVRDPGNGLLTAFSYTSQSSISQIWQVPANINGGSVAIGADGGIYITDSTSLHSLIERDPTDGHILKSISVPFEFSFGATPIVSAKSLFVWSTEFGPVTEVYDLNTFARVRFLPRGRGGSNTAYQGPGAIFDNGYVLYHTDGFDVYWAVPEPSTLVLTLGMFALLTVRRVCS